MIESTSPKSIDVRSFRESAQIDQPHPSKSRESTGLNVVILVYRDGLGAIFESAYLGLAHRLMEHDVQPQIVTMSALGEWVRPPLRRRWSERFAAVERACPGRLTRLPVPPVRYPSAWNEAKLLAKWLRRRYRAGEPVVVHAGGTEAIHLCLQARRHFPSLKAVFQCWGPTAAEFLYGRVGHEENDAPPDIARQAQVFEQQDRAAFVEADAIVSIGEAMTRHLSDTYDVPAEKTLQIPCCVDYSKFSQARSSRERTRRELGLDDQFIATFVGSLHRWQEPDGVIRAFELIQEQQANAHLLALTPNPEQLTQLLLENQLAHNRFTVLRVPHDEVPKYLNASDIGLLGRGLLQRPSLVNAISSPIKYAEYLASGCPVTLSEGVGDYSALTRDEKVGVVIPHRADDDVMRQHFQRFLANYLKAPERLRDRCRAIAEERLNAARYDAQLVELYHTLASHDIKLGSPDSEFAHQP